MITISEIETWRRLRKITKKELALRLGITYPYLVSILNGKQELSESVAAKFELMANGARKGASRYDDVRAFAVRLTNEEYEKLCLVAGAQDLTSEQAEAAVRDLLQRTWDKAVDSVGDPDEIGEALDAAET